MRPSDAALGTVYRAGSGEHMSRAVMIDGEIYGAPRRGIAEQDCNDRHTSDYEPSSADTHNWSRDLGLLG